MANTSAFETLVSDAKADNQAIDMGQDQTWEVSPTATIDMSGIPAMVGENVTIDFTGAHEWDVGPILEWRGGTTVVGTNISGTKGDHTITIDTGLSLENGDTLLIASTENMVTQRAYYRKGERKYVRHYDSATGECEIAEPLQFSYDGTTSANRVHTVQEQEVYIGQGITFVGDPSLRQRGLNFQWCDVDLRCRFERLTERATNFVACRGDVGIRVFGSTDEADPTIDYGITVGEFSDLTITSHIWGARHCVATGAANTDFTDESFAGGSAGTAAVWPSRNTINGGIYGVAASKPSKDQRAIDAHGQALSMNVHDALIYGGVHSAAKYTRISDCEIHFNESNGYYNSSDIGDSGRTWGEHIIENNTFIAEGSADNPPGYWFEIESVDTTNNVITVKRNATVALQNGDLIRIKDATTKEGLASPTANGTVTYDAASHTTDIPVDSISTDYTGEFIYGGRGQFMSTNAADGMKSLTIRGNTFKGDYGNSTEQWLSISRPLEEVLIFEDNVIRPINTNQQGYIDAHNSVSARNNIIENTELEIKAQANNVEIDISGTSCRDSFRRGMVLDGNEGFQITKVIANGVKAFSCAQSGYLIREVEEVHVSEAVSQNNGSDTSASNSSRANIALIDCEYVEVFNSQLSSTANTVWNLAILKDDITSTEYRVAHLDVRGGSGDGIHLSTGGTYFLLDRKGIVADTPADYPDVTGDRHFVAGQTSKPTAHQFAQVNAVAQTGEQAGVLAYAEDTLQKAGLHTRHPNDLGVEISSNQDGTGMEGRVRVRESDTHWHDPIVANVPDTSGDVTLSIQDGSHVDATRALGNVDFFSDTVVVQPDGLVKTDTVMQVGAVGAVTPAAGMMQWTGSEFQVYDGTTWTGFAVTDVLETFSAGLIIDGTVIGSSNVVRFPGGSENAYIHAGGNHMVLNNAYWDGANFIYEANGGASRVGYNPSEAKLEAAPSGTAGNAISWETSVSAEDDGAHVSRSLADGEALLFLSAHRDFVWRRRGATASSAALRLESDAGNLIEFGDGSTVGLAINPTNGRVGVAGVTTPSAELEVGGVILVGGSGGVTDAAGMIRWNGTDFAGYDGSTWNSFTSTGGSYTDEQAQDAAAAMLTGGTGINGSYDDAGNTYTFSLDASTSDLNDWTSTSPFPDDLIAWNNTAGEWQLLDAQEGILYYNGSTWGDLPVGSGLNVGAGPVLDLAMDIEDGGTSVIAGHGINFGTNLSVTDDGDGTVTVDASGGAGYTDEDAQDAVGLNFDGSLSYDDATPSFGVATGGIDISHLSFDPATQTELNNHAGSSSAHHTKPSAGDGLTGTNSFDVDSTVARTNVNESFAGDVSADKFTAVLSGTAQVIAENQSANTWVQIAGGGSVAGVHYRNGNTFVIRENSGTDPDTLSGTNRVEIGNEIHFFNGLGERLMALESGGDVGIGPNADPAHTLHVQDAGMSMMIEDTSGTAVLTYKDSTGSYMSTQWNGTNFRYNHSTNGVVRQVHEDGSLLGDGVVQAGGSGGVTDSAGMIRYNSGNLEYYDGSTWQTLQTV